MNINLQEPQQIKGRILHETDKKFEQGTRISRKNSKVKLEDQILHFLKDKIKFEQGKNAQNHPLTQTKFPCRGMSSKFLKVSFLNKEYSHHHTFGVENQDSEQIIAGGCKSKEKKNIVIDGHSENSQFRPATVGKFYGIEEKVNFDTVFENTPKNKASTRKSHKSILSLLTLTKKDAEKKLSVSEKLDIESNVNFKDISNNQFLLHERLDSQENLICKSNIGTLREKRGKSDAKRKNVTSIETGEEGEEVNKWDEIINSDFLLMNNGNSNQYFSRSLRRTKLVYDSLSDYGNKILIDSPGSALFTVNPNSNVVLCIQLLVCFSLIFTLIYHPLHLAFASSKLQSNINSLDYSGLFVDIMLCFELIISFFVRLNEDEEVSYNPSATIQDYLRGSFFMNFIVAFPMTTILKMLWLFNPELNKQSAYIFIAKRCLWLRMLGTFKLWKLLDLILFRLFQLEEFNKKLQKILFIKVSFFFILVFHIISSLWIYIGIASESTNNWICYHGLMDMPNYFIYVSSFYYNMATILSIGYGDIYPVSIEEKVYICFLMFISTQIYSLIVSWLSRIIYQISQKDEVFTKNEDVVKKILKDYKISKPLEKQLKKSLNLMKKNYVKDKNILLDSLPDRLKNIIYKRIYKNRMGELDFFKCTSEDFILNCTHRIQSVILKKREVLISIGDMFSELYMVNKGALQFTLGPIFENFRINTIGSGYHFGDVNMYLDERSEYTIKSSCSCTEVFTLKKSFYSELKINFPEIINKIMKKSVDNFTSLEALRKSAYEYFDKHGTMVGFRNEATTYLLEKHLIDTNHDDKRNISDLYLHSNNIDIQELTKLLDENCVSKSINSLNNFQQNAGILQKTKKQNNINATKLSEMQMLQKCNIDSSKLKISELLGSPLKSNAMNLQLPFSEVRNPNKNISNLPGITKQYIKDNRKRQLNRKMNMEIPELGSFANRRPNLAKKFKEDEGNYYIYLNSTKCRKVLGDNSFYSNYYTQLNSQRLSSLDVHLNLSPLLARKKKNQNLSSEKLVFQNLNLSGKSSSKMQKEAQLQSNKNLRIVRKQTIKLENDKPVSNNTSRKAFRDESGKSLIIEANNHEEEQQPKSFKLKRCKTQFNSRNNAEILNQESEKKGAGEANTRKDRFLELDRQEMMKDFERRIDKNAFYENNMNLYEGYLKNLIETKKGAVASKLESNLQRKNTIRSALKVNLAQNFKYNYK